jgi:flagellar motor switch protein FliG
MLEEVQLINHIRQHLEPADFQDERISRIVSLLFDLLEQGKSVEPNRLMNHLEDEEIMQVICETTFLPEVSTQNKEEVVEDCIRRLKTQKVKLKRQQLHDQIKLAQHLGDEEKLQSLIREFDNLIKISED